MEIDAVDVTVVACCQVAPALGDPAANRELAAAAVSGAATQGASVVVLPELVSSGYVFESRAEARASAEAADGETVTLWARLAADHEVVIVGATLTAGPVTIAAECRLDSARDKAIGPLNDVHADRRPGLYRRIAEEAVPQQTRSAG